MAIRHIKSGLLLRGFGNGQTFYSSFMIKRLYWYLFTNFFYKVMILADIAIFSTVRMEKN